ncbi:hypothetical protein N7532_000544 [Penicillium argentinense]|uniref:Uncharacterized protein n=1 Tax=Penicillium argentinense TaxID=1131581 RepID=A0A9W9KMQ8_9EURO|nr:uncharacterized protein N7532_000544 [Penicillium argentinense]KAJ5112499.1 hypothetical protein N7532_000544 [Penicillium argentinense]
MEPEVFAGNFSLPYVDSRISARKTPPRVAQYDVKNKDSEPRSDAEDLSADITDAVSVEDSVPRKPLVLTPNETHQYRIAGLPLDQELPGGRFPHAAPENSAPPDRHTHTTAYQLTHDLPKLPISIYAPRSQAFSPNLRFRHLAALTTLLHRCLLDGDFTRAGRAWGLITRELFERKPLDVRVDHRWGIGAEILLRRNQPAASGHQSSFKALGNEDRTSLPFTRKGFAEAKEYYERLVVNYPWKKIHEHVYTHTTTSLQIYPAMFGLWVYVAQEESRSERDKIEDEVPSEHSDEESMDEYGERSESDRKEALIAKVRQQELEEARQIATSMDSILASPPFSDSPQLLELRGNVSLWVGDLLAFSLVKPPPEFLDEYYDPMETDEANEPLEIRREQEVAMKRRQVEINKSQEFMKRARKYSRGVAKDMERLGIVDDAFN